MNTDINLSRSSSVSGQEDRLEDQEQKGTVGDEVREVRSCARSCLKSLAQCLAGTAVVVGVPALVANLGVLGCGVGIVLNEFNCSTEAAVGLAGVGLTTGLVSTGAYFLQRELVKRLSGQQPSQGASADDPSQSGSASSSSSRGSESLVELSSQVPPQEYEGQELDP